MAKRKKQVKEKNKFRFSKLIVLMVIMLNVLFTIGTLYVFLRVGNEPAVLIGSWFAFTGTELVNLAILKVKDK